MRVKEKTTPLFKATGAAGAGNNSNVIERSYINANEAAQLLGVCKPSILHAVAENKIPYKRIGRRLVFSPKALEKWVACED